MMSAGRYWILLYLGYLQEKKAVSELAALEEAQSCSWAYCRWEGVASEALQDKSIYYGSISYQSLEAEKG